MTFYEGTDLTLEDIHNIYFNELNSLDKTCVYLLENYNININRQKLSKVFKRANLEVRFPNGHFLEHWIDTDSHLDAESKICAKVIETAWEDMLDPEYRINYISAAAFIADEFYERALATISRNVRYTTVDRHMLPEGITINKIIEGREMYERQYRFWIAG